MEKKYQSNQYDKILKENIEAVIPNLIQNVLGITVVSSEELPDDIQHTKERKPDALKQITDLHGNIFILQIEFQVLDEQEMVYRMAEYYIMLARKYKLPIRQFVLFLGSDVPKMSTEYKSHFMSYNFSLISFSELDYKIFLKSSKPEEIVLGILANFKEEDQENVIKRIIYRIEETTEGDFSLKRYFQQLRILAQLRNLELQLKTAMESIAKYISEERDVLYLRGKDKARQEEQTKFVSNLLNKLELSIEQIADIAGVSVDFVKAIKQKLSSEK
ncbi:hypothetical protein [Runella aurantiaca]|uniref:Rpn family recombination-promoting nuclease/putative transposase n=1 Tax=Runella aurantiaca TaxID=2282308 RepID=A0A369IA11_9BACT|nr:hypothetical protein [Runella aurantiaca]RDB03506.1 hypothetical protein DVG78_23640 [Runella aurantiaca]